MSRSIPFLSSPSHPGNAVTVIDFAFPRRLVTGLTLIVVVAAGWLATGLAMAQNVPTTQDVPTTHPAGVDIGFGGVVKLGKWVPIFIDVDPSLKPTRFELRAIDGDDTPVIYSGKLLLDADHPNHYQALARFGRTLGRIELGLFNSANERVMHRELQLRGDEQIASFHHSTRELIVTLESDEMLANAIITTSGFADRDSARVVVALGIDDALPLNWLGYDEVKTVLLVTSDLDRVRQFSTKQIDALEAWVQKGGTLVLSAAENSESLLSQGGILQRFSPGVFVGTREFTKSRRLETYAGSREQLISTRGKPITISEFSDIRGQVTVASGASTPLVIREASGLGQVVFTTFDLDSDRLTQWKSFPHLLERIISGDARRSDEVATQKNPRGNAVSHYGFTDLIGQLRVPLDQFSTVKFVSFTWVALLIGLYILCIGPGDYFFLRKLLGKMELTWITFPLVSLLFCGLAIGISKMTRPNSIQINQLEIIDIDVVTGRARGSVWTNLYSPSGGTGSVEFDLNHHLGFSVDSDVISWHGLPGTGLGGMQSTMGPGLLKPKYEHVFELSDNGQDWHTVLEELPLPVAATRPLFGQWWSDNPVEIQSLLRQPLLTRGEGTIKNPFDFTLHNCRLVYEDWVYVLDQPLGPGQEVDLKNETTGKSLHNFLTRSARTKEKKDRSLNRMWNTSDTRINRIADMMMFYEAAGGKNYTHLTHNYQAFTDMTTHQNLKRAILIGEVNSVGSVLKIDGTPMLDHYDRTTTIVRVVFPVKPVNTTSNNP